MFNVDIQLIYSTEFKTQNVRISAILALNKFSQNRYRGSDNTFDMENDLFTVHWVCVNCTPVSPLILRPDVTHLQVPLLDLWPDDAEPCVVDDSSIFVGEGNTVMVEPRHLSAATRITANTL